MSSRKSPLQILQSLTQKRFSEPKTRSVLSVSDIYQSKTESDVLRVGEANQVRKNISTEYSKIPNLDSGNGFSTQTESRNKSPFKMKRPASKGGSAQLEKIQLNSTGTTGKLLIGVKNSGKEPSYLSNHDSVSSNKKSKDSDISNLVKSRLELAWNDYNDEDYNSAYIHLTKAEELIEKTMSAQEQLPFVTIFLTLYNMIAVQYKYNSSFI